MIDIGKEVNAFTSWPTQERLLALKRIIPRARVEEVLARTGQDRSFCSRLPGCSDSILLLMSGRGGLGFLDISENRLVSRDRERDLAVLEIPVSHVRRQGKLFSTWNSWPPPRPAVGMPALIYGYPGEGRVPLGNSLGIRPLTMGRYVTSVTDRHFSLADIHGDSEMRTPEGATPITSYGGISGSAVYIIQSNSESFQQPVPPSTARTERLFAKPPVPTRIKR